MIRAASKGTSRSVNRPQAEEIWTPPPSSDRFPTAPPRGSRTARPRLQSDRTSSDRPSSLQEFRTSIIGLRTSRTREVCWPGAQGLIEA